MTEKGKLLTKVPGVTLCYERRAVPDAWPYNLYCMIHGRSRSEALDVLSLARVRAELTGYDYKVSVQHPLLQTDRGADRQEDEGVRLDSIDREIINSLQEGLSAQRAPLHRSGAKAGAE